MNARNTHDFQRVVNDAMAMTDAQRAALANRLVLSIRDPDCEYQVSLIESSAARVGVELGQRAATRRARA